MEERLVPLSEVQSMVGLSKQRITALEAEGRFPLRVKHDGYNSKVLYFLTEILKWIEQFRQNRNPRPSTPKVLPPSRRRRPGVNGKTS